MLDPSLSMDSNTMMNYSTSSQELEPLQSSGSFSDSDPLQSKRLPDVLNNLPAVIIKQNVELSNFIAGTVTPNFYYVYSTTGYDSHQKFMKAYDSGVCCCSNDCTYYDCACSHINVTGSNLLNN